MLKNWLIYLLLRLAAFAMPLAILLAANVDPLFAAGISAVLALALSLLFFGKQRDLLSRDLYARVQHRKEHGQADADSDIENQILDSKND
jgi:predicted Na+-dependent transporter